MFVTNLGTKQKIVARKADLSVSSERAINLVNVSLASVIKNIVLNTESLRTLVNTIVRLV